jgi:hypothetical protein
MRSSFKKFPGFADIIYRNLDCQGIVYYEFIPEGETVIKEMYIDLGTRSEGNAPISGKPRVGFSFTTMLQHTGRFSLKIS